MTVTNTNNKVIYTGDGATTVFAYTFKIFEDADLDVIQTVISTGVETTLVLNSDYTVSGAGNPSGGNVTVSSTTPTALENLTIVRTLDITQETDYVENDPFPAESHEEALDRLTMICQQISEIASRAVVLAVNASNLAVTLPPPLADATIGWDPTATFLINNPAASPVNFTGLLDTPSSYSGQGGKTVKVNSGATALEFVTVSGGGGGGTGVTNDVNQTTHGFSVGDVIRADGTQTYAKALADTSSNAEVVGIVSAVADVDNFTVQMGGYVESLSGLTANTVYFLSESGAGTLTATEPGTIGEISKPLLITDTTTSGYFFNFRGQEITDAGVASSAAQVADVITQSSHGFSKGEVLRHNGTIYVLALADDEDNADVVGMVEEVVDANDFKLLQTGYIIGLTGLTAGDDHYLSESNAGEITTTEPSANGEVSKPVLVADTTTSGWFFANMRGVVIGQEAVAGQQVQVVNTLNVAHTTHTIVMPEDDTIPQITEGDEVMTLAITPTSASNNLLIEVLINTSCNIAPCTISMALFQDATADALNANGVEWIAGTGDRKRQMVLRHFMTAGTVSATTFRVRVGPHSAGTISINGEPSAGRFYGGVMASTITITEIQT